MPPKRKSRVGSHQCDTEIYIRALHEPPAAQKTKFGCIFLAAINSVLKYVGFSCIIKEIPTCLPASKLFDLSRKRLLIGYLEQRMMMMTMMMMIYDDDDL